MKSRSQLRATLDAPSLLSKVLIPRAAIEFSDSICQDSEMGV